MKLIRRAKTPSATDCAGPAAPSADPVDDLQGLEALAAMLQRLQAHNAQYQRATGALIAARRVVNGWDPQPEPDLTWSVRHEVLIAAGDKDTLAAFEREHAAELAAEQSARQAVMQQAIEAPARIKAIEQFIRDLAGRMVDDLDEGFMHEEMKRVFLPSAQRLLVAAKSFVGAWREMRTVAYVLTTSLRPAHYSIYGDTYSGYDLSLIGKPREGEWLPTLIEGIEYDDLVELNEQYQRIDDELARQLAARLAEAGISGKRLSMFHPGTATDERTIDAPDPNPPSRRPPTFYDRADV